MLGRLGCVAPGLGRLHALLLEPQRQGGLGVLPRLVLALPGGGDVFCLSRQDDLRLLLVSDLGRLEGELGPADRVALTLEDYLLRLFGQVVGLVHLLELAELLPHVFEHVLAVLQRVGRVLLRQRAVDLREAFEVLHGPLLIAGGLGELLGRGLLEESKLLFGLLDGHLPHGQAVRASLDFPIDLLQVQPDQLLALLDGRAVLDGPQHAKLRPRLRRERHLRRPRRLEPAAQLALHPEAAAGDLVGLGLRRLLRSRRLALLVSRLGRGSHQQQQYSDRLYRNCGKWQRQAVSPFHDCAPWGGQRLSPGCESYGPLRSEASDGFL